MTALGEKLINHNLAMPKLDSPLYMTAIEFFKKSGGRDRAHEIIDRAYERVNPNDDAGINGAVPDEGHGTIFPASSPQANGSGHGDPAQPRQPHTAAPVRPPYNLTGGVADGMKNVLAQSVFDRVKTNDGRSWGDVGAQELDGMSRDGAFASALRNKIGVLTNAQRFMKIRDLISPEKFEQIRNDVNASQAQG